MDRKVFISYGREDDEPFVHRLHGDLVARGVPVWWDREAMESRGQTFLQVIRDAIALECDRLLFVVGPHAVGSDYVRYEWEHALQYCKVVTPVVRLGDPDAVPRRLKDVGYNLVPQELALFHAPDFRSDDRYGDALDDLIRILNSPPLPAGREIGIEWTSGHYVERPDYLHRLKASVLRDVTGPTVITSALQTTALQGMGGIGKSVLAAAFGRACFTRRSFGDGVLWLTFGRQDGTRLDVALENMRRVGVELGCLDLANAEATVASSRLADCLATKACLLILDDVWQADHAYPFVRAAEGTRSRVLLTTRDAGLVRSLDAAQCEVDVLSEDAALDLLARSSRVARDRLPSPAPAIAKQCGYLPLGLAMVGSMVAGRPADRWQDVLTLLEQADLARIAHEFPEYKDKPNLLVAMQVSVDALTAGLQQRYLDFAVFGEDERVPEAVFLSYWKPLGLDEAAVHQAIDTLVDRSLVRRDDSGLLSLHDIQHDYLRVQVKDLAALRARFLDSYRQRCLPGDWPDGPNDGYFFQHLVEQLVAADRIDEAERLLALDAADGGNAWQRANEAIGHARGYVADLDRAYALASGGAAASRPPNVSRQCRYALMRSSLAAIGRNLPIDVSLAMYAAGIETAEQLLDRAQSLPEQDAQQLFRKLQTLWTFGSRVPEPHRTQAFDLALRVVRTALRSRRFDEDRVAGPFGGAIRRMPRQLLSRAADVVAAFGDAAVRDGLNVVVAIRYMEEGDPAAAMAMAQAIGEPSSRAIALREMSGSLGSVDMDAALTMLAGIQPVHRGAAVPALAARLAALGRAREALDLIRAQPDEDDAARALAGMAEHLEGATVRDAILAARALTRNTALRAVARMELASRLPPAERTAEAAEIWDAALSSSEKSAEDAPRDLMPLLPMEVVDGIDLFVLPEELHSAYVERLAALRHADRALAIADEAEEERRTSMLEGIARHAGAADIDAVLQRIRQLTDGQRRERVLRITVPRMAKLGRGNEALRLALAMRNVDFQSATLENMAPYLEASDLRTAARALTRIGDAAEQQAASDRLASLVPALLPVEFALAIRRTTDPGMLDAAIGHLAADAPALLDDVHQAILGMEDQSVRAGALLSLAAHVTWDRIEDVVRASWDEAWTVRYLVSHLERLAAVIDRVPAALRIDIDEAGRSVWMNELRRRLKNRFDDSAIGLAAVLARLGHHQLVRDAIGTPQDDPRHHLRLRAAVQPFLPSPDRETVLDELIREVERAENPYDPIIDLGHVRTMSEPLLRAVVRVLRTKAEIRHAVTETSAFSIRFAEAGLFDEAYALAAELIALSPAQHLQALAAIARGCPVAQLGGVLRAGVAAAVHVTNPVNHRGYRSKMIEPLVPALLRAPDAELRALWTELVYGLSRYPRPELLLDLSVLSPIAARLGRTRAVVEIREDIVRVARWWP